MRAEVKGQVIEWMAWTSITEKSGGALHVYLPERDMGVDAMVRESATGRRCAVQVKGRTDLNDGIFHVHVQTAEADVPDAVLLALVVDVESLTVREPVFVVPMSDVRELAPLVPYGADRSAYSVEIPFPPGARTHWLRFGCALSDLPVRLFLGLTMVEGGLQPGEARLNATGYVGEMALLRHLAASEVLSVFHAAPDYEFVEYLVLRVDTGRSLGLQVKCVEIRADDARGVVMFTGDVVAREDEYCVIFARVRSDGADAELHEDCFLVPAAEVARLAVRRDGRMELDVDMAGLESWRVKVRELVQVVEGMLGG